MREIYIGREEAGQRMDRCIGKYLDLAPRGFICKMLRKKNILLNGRKAGGGEILREGDSIRIYFSEETIGKFSTKIQGADTKRQGSSLAPPIEIIYEDDDILVVNKPAGMLSQKASTGDYSVNEWARDYLRGSAACEKSETAKEAARGCAVQSIFRPSVCNRLDRNTSGLIIIGKSVHGLRRMSGLIKSRKIQKYYLCIVKGEITEPIRLSAYLTKDEGKNRVRILDIEGESTKENKAGEEGEQKVSKDIDAAAIEKGKRTAESHHTESEKKTKHEASGRNVETEIRPIRANGGITMLEVHLITGRPHQIRAHLSHIGHPILGDPKYGDSRLNRSIRERAGVRAQLLHAWRMEFPGGMTLTAPPPDVFDRVNALYYTQKEIETRRKES